MTSLAETTAAMTPQAEQHEPADIVGGSPGSGTAAPSEPAHEGAGVLVGVGERASDRRELSLSVVISLFGGLLTALLGALIGLMMWQFNALGARIDGLSARIDGQDARIDSLGTRIDSLGTRIGVLGTDLRAEMDELGTSLRAEMSDLETRLRAEMRAGFAEVNMVLLDHTDRLARLETAAGLPRVRD